MVLKKWNVGKFASHEAALIAMPVNAMCADPRSGTITFVNERSRATLKGIEDELPCKVDDLVGKSIDIFHKHPAGPRAIIADPERLPHTARVRLGKHTLQLTVTPLHDAKGRYAQAMLTWTMLSAKELALDEHLPKILASVGTVRAQIEGAAAVVEELSMTSRQIGGRADEASSGAKEVDRQVHLCVGSINDLKLATDQIGGTLDLINKIAAQTNLLALNASIEAARAGESGRGFNVVAMEVKELAAQVASAVESINERVDAVRESVDTVSEGVGVISDTSKGLSELASAVAVAVREQGQATEELSATTDSVAAEASAIDEKAAAVRKTA